MKTKKDLLFRSHTHAQTAHTNNTHNSRTPHTTQVKKKKKKPSESEKDKKKAKKAKTKGSARVSKANIADFPRTVGESKRLSDYAHLTSSAGECEKNL